MVDNLLWTALIVGEEYEKLIDTDAIPHRIISENADVDIYSDLQDVVVETRNRIHEMEKTEYIEDLLYERTRKVAREVILDKFVGKKKTFSIRYFEYYEGFYDVEARNLEEAQDILYEDIREGRREGPDQCYFMDSEEVSE